MSSIIKMTYVMNSCELKLIWIHYQGSTYYSSFAWSQSQFFIHSLIIFVPFTKTIMSLTFLSFNSNWKSCFWFNVCTDEDMYCHFLVYSEITAGWGQRCNRQTWPVVSDAHVFIVVLSNSELFLQKHKLRISAVFLQLTDYDYLKTSRTV